jgi:hypothetical protein
VGIVLPIQDWVGNDYHVIQFWEELTDPIPVTEFPAAEVYQMLVNRFCERAAPSGQLPTGMPEVLEGLSVRTYRDGKAGYVLFEPLDSLGGNIRICQYVSESITTMAMPNSVWVKVIHSEGWPKNSGL